MKNKTAIQVLNITGFLVMIFVNYLANVLPLNNLSTGEVSGLYPDFFAPAGFTFAIWGIIYLTLLGFCIYQARDILSSEKKDMPFLRKTGFLFSVSCFLNAVWIIAWHYLLITLSMIIMIALLFVLIRIYLNLGIGIKNVSREENIWVNLPFRIYLGWITIATIANASALLVHWQWNGFGLPDTFWTTLVIAAATVITILFLKNRRDLVVGIVAIWSVFGIAVKRITVEPLEIAVIISSITALLIIVLFTAMLALKIYNEGEKSK